MSEGRIGRSRPKLYAFGAAPGPVAMQEITQRVESAGFSGLWIPEGSQPVFSMCTAAALGATEFSLGTSVALAFPRSPMLTAQAAWMLANMTGGRFNLGLGTQVRAHIERRFSSAFSDPGPRMREYVLALRHIFAGFRGEPLNFEGKYYNFSLLPSIWSPGPMEYPDPQIYVAGVRPWMCRMIGEVADGILVHPLSSISYIDSVVLPAIAAGAVSVGRSASEVQVVCPVMTAVSDDAAIRNRQRESIRARLAFYGSTPGYGVVFDETGYPGVGEELHRLQRAGDFDGMSRLISDDILETMSITSTWDELPRKLIDRFAGRADHIVCYSVIENWDHTPGSLEHWRDVNRRFEVLTNA
jgi:probable F420-dependent oxidoreductase